MAKRYLADMIGEDYKRWQPGQTVLAATNHRQWKNLVRSEPLAPLALDFPLLCRVVRPYTALYVVSVRRPETLPCRGPFNLCNPASFRFHLAMDTLAFG